MRRSNNKQSRRNITSKSHPGLFIKQKLSPVEEYKYVIVFVFFFHKIHHWSILLIICTCKVVLSHMRLLISTSPDLEKYLYATGAVVWPSEGYPEIAFRPASLLPLSTSLALLPRITTEFTMAMLLLRPGVEDRLSLKVQLLINWHYFVEISN